MGLRRPADLLDDRIEVIGDDKLLEHAEQDAEQAFKVVPGVSGFAFQAWRELLIPLDGAGNHRRKEKDEGEVVEEINILLKFPFIRSAATWTRLKRKEQKLPTGRRHAGAVPA